MKKLLQNLANPAIQFFISGMILAAIGLVFVFSSPPDRISTYVMFGIFVSGASMFFIASTLYEQIIACMDKNEELRHAFTRSYIVKAIPKPQTIKLDTGIVLVADASQGLTNSQWIDKARESKMPFVYVSGMLYHVSGKTLQRPLMVVEEGDEQQQQ